VATVKRAHDGGDAVEAVAAGCFDFWNILLKQTAKKSVHAK